VSLWLAAARAPADLEGAPRSLDAVGALMAQLDGHPASAGIHAAAGALDAHRRLHAILDTVDPIQLEATRRQLAALEHELRERADLLTRLLDLKRRLPER
jgi:hypothetical protein